MSDIDKDVKEMLGLSEEDLKRIESRVDNNLSPEEQADADARANEILEGLELSPEWYERTAAAHGMSVRKLRKRIVRGGKPRVKKPRKPEPLFRAALMEKKRKMWPINMKHG